MSLTKLGEMTGQERLGEWIQRALNWNHKFSRGEEKTKKDFYGLLFWDSVGHIKNTIEKGTRNIPVTHPTKYLVFICINISRSVIIHELYSGHSRS